jgi:hypothetical protein
MLRLGGPATAIVVSLALAGCQMNLTSDKATVRGHVSEQVCPGYTYPGKVCPPRAAAKWPVHFISSDGKTTVTVVTDAGGNYSTQLAPGTYRIDIAAGVPEFSGPHQISVRAGDLITADLGLGVVTA